MALRGVLVAGVVLAMGVAGAAFAAGGGGGGMGGGGGDMPTASGPQYNPVEEFNKGQAAMNAGDYKEAERAFQHLTAALPKNAQGWRLLGLANLAQGDFKGARKAYEKAVKLEPEGIAGHEGLGKALAGLRDPGAQGQLDWLNARAAACAGTCPEAASLKAATTAVQTAMTGGPTAARSVPGAMLFSGPAAGDQAYVAAVGLINEKRYDEALASLARAAGTFGPHPDILTYEGYAWRKKGDLDKAEAYYRQALAVAPYHLGATEYYGELMVVRGDLAGARAMLARAEGICAFGCAEAEELRRWIDAGGDPAR